MMTTLVVGASGDTFASTLIKQGASLYAVQKMMRHKNPITTQRYADLDQASIESEYDKLRL